MCTMIKIIQLWEELYVSVFNTNEEEVMSHCAVYITDSVVPKEKKSGGKAKETFQNTSCRRGAEKKVPRVKSGVTCCSSAVRAAAAKGPPSSLIIVIPLQKRLH